MRIYADFPKPFFLLAALFPFSDILIQCGFCYLPALPCAECFNLLLRYQLVRLVPSYAEFVL